ncbi:MAG: hypothetical protein KGS48_16880 [Bacteroidetes bacterium]|nr:hypothetical protein [Bacteroidota bacterium]
MTPYKNYSTASDWSHRIKKGGMYLAVAALIGGEMGCGGSNNGTDWEQVTVQEATKGVITTIEEKEAGNFVIADEKVVDSKDASRVIIKRLDGKTDTLTLDQAKTLVQPADTVFQQNTNYVQHYHHGGGMGSVLWWGAMGYMMGRSFNSPVQQGIYRNGYNAGGAYWAGSAASQELRRTAVSRTQMRPVRGRSGFFRGWGGKSGG